MSGSKDLKEFPDLSNKLAAPKKQSLFERQKAEAEAKRIREEAETAAVYEDFVKSFEDDDGSGGGNHGASRGRGGYAPEARIPSGPGKRHFTSMSNRSSGPGSLTPASLPRKRALDGSRVDRTDKGKEKGIFAFDESAPTGPMDTATAFQTSDDEDEKEQVSKSGERATPKPTLQLSSLPPGTSIPVIKKLLPENLVVDSVRVLPPSGPGSSSSVERKSMSAIVAFTQDTPASDLDVTVSSLQNKYLGWGFYLSLSRHLSSSTLGSMSTTSSNIHSSLTSLPFGAQPIPIAPGPPIGRAPPHGSHRGGYAPPSSFAPPEHNSFGRVPPLQVKVTPPTDLRELKVIHKTVEAVITHGPEFEALLMQRPEVQRDEKWAWIRNSRSQGGVWYRWRLWQILSGINSQQSSRRTATMRKVFEGGVPWLEPEEELHFEFTTEFTDLISASDYNSSDDEDSDEEGALRRRRRQFDGPAPSTQEASAALGNNEQSYLNPLQRAKLTHLLARLPTTIARLRKGDVARVTTFAITHAGQSAEEIVDILVSNVLRPLSGSKNANPDLRRDGVDTDMDGADTEDMKDRDDAYDRKDTQQDISASTLIGLYLISDILSASSISGVRHAWRYRSQIETAFHIRNFFAYLGRMEKDLTWGRLRAEKWRRSVNGVLQLWEGWSVFPAATQEKFVQQFNNPPLSDEEAAAEQEKKVEKAGVKDAAKSRWKSVDVNAAAEDGATPSTGEQPGPMDVDVQPVLDGSVKRVTKVEARTPPTATSVDQPMKDVIEMPVRKDLDAHMAKAAEVGPTTPTASSVTEAAAEAKPDGGDPSMSAKRRRPRAEDMFADSDED